jgi:folate-binding protein YgfZ
MTPLKHLAVITAQGEDAAAFLHNQLTADITNLPIGSATFACLCQPKGRVIALLLVSRVAADSITLLCQHDIATGLVTYLQRYVFRDKVVLELPAGLSVFTGDASASDDAALQRIEVLDGLSYVVAETLDAEDAQNPAALSEAFRAQELAQGVLWLSPETTEQFLPQMLGYEAIGALNFKKGCFPGQEIVARTRYLGKLKRFPWLGTLGQALNAVPMAELTLIGEKETDTASAVLVAQAPRSDEQWQVAVVARPGTPFEVRRIILAGVEIEAQGNWSLPENQ